jgi:hypothetical protein
MGANLRHLTASAKCRDILGLHSVI